MLEGTLVDAEIVDAKFPYHAYDCEVLPLTQSVEFLGFVFQTSSHPVNWELSCSRICTIIRMSNKVKL